MPFWQLFSQGRDGHALLVRPLRIPRWTPTSSVQVLIREDKLDYLKNPLLDFKILFVLGSYEVLALLNGKIGECQFF